MTQEPLALSRRLAALAALGALAALALASCGRPSDPVRATLDGLGRAAEKGDAGAVGERLSASFRAASGEGRDEAVALVRRYLAAYDSLGIRLQEVTIERGPDRAHATFKVEMSGTPRAALGLDAVLPRASSWRFDVRLQKEERDRWRVVEAAWERLS